MKIIYISPVGGYNVNLFPYFYETFAANGHTWVTNVEEATHCFVELQIEGNKYPLEFEAILMRDIPIICFDNREYGEGRPEAWEKIAFSPNICFIRNMRKSFTYPENCYPFDWAVFKNSEHPLATKEELFSRPYDCSFIGTLSKTREKFTNAILRDGRLKFDFQDRDHTKRFSTYEQYLNEHRKAKLYISCDGAGLTNERPMQLYTVAAMLKNKSDLRSANPYTDLVNCIEVNEEPTKEDIDKILYVLEDADWLYLIYTNGVKHARTHLSHDAVSNYVLKTLSGNNI